MDDLELLEHLFDNYYQPLHVESFEAGEAELFRDISNGKSKERLLSAINNLNKAHDFSWLDLMKKCAVDTWFVSVVI